jgi:hypothetical protein
MQGSGQELIPAGCSDAVWEKCLLGGLEGSYYCYYYDYYYHHYNYLPMTLQPILELCPPYTVRYVVGLPWTSDEPVAEASTYAEQHNIRINTRQTSMHALSNQAADALRLRPRGHWGRH